MADENKNMQGQAEAPSKIDEAKELLAKVEEANKRLEANISKAEQINVEKILGGEASAGQEVKKMTADEKITAEAKAFLEGTGFEGVI